MLAPHRLYCRRRAALRPVWPALLPGLGGCAAGQAGAAAWGLAALALLLAAAGGFVLGRLLERQRYHAELRAARAAQIRAERLHGNNWCWETDAEHRLLRWRGPGQADSRPCVLFDARSGDEELLGLLQARQAFGALRASTPQASHGSRGWLLRGEPRHDDQGRFAGFVGLAEPTDACDALACDAAALASVLATQDTPLLLAHDHGEGWRVQQGNPAAQALWHGLVPETPLESALQGAPAAVVAACVTLQPGTVLEIDGWRLAGYGPLPAGGRGLLLSRPANTKAAAPASESDNFSFTVSHDLRAPIRVVEGFTRIVKEDYGRLLDRVGNDHLDRVLGAAARMNLMIDALLNLARLSTQPLAQQPVNLSQLAGYVIDDLRRGAPEREVEVEIEPGLATVGDPTLLRLVLENLLGNAWKYSSRVARAQISLGRVPHGAGVAYVVRDNGAGFDMRSAERLFGLFQRLHSASEFPGTGVGLASVRRIVQRHGGDIWADSEPGRGAAFYFTLAA